jgi:hypothetical protein
VTFEHPAASAPPAFRAWSYPGNSIGEEFVYPKDRAVALARTAHSAVKATSDTMTAHMNAQEPAAQQQAVTALKDAPVQEARPAGDRVEVVEADSIQMPNTASNLPTDLAAGVMLILLGVAVQRIGRLARGVTWAHTAASRGPSAWWRAPSSRSGRGSSRRPRSGMLRRGTRRRGSTWRCERRHPTAPHRLHSSQRAHLSHGG